MTADFYSRAIWKDRKQLQITCLSILTHIFLPQRIMNGLFILKAQWSNLYRTNKPSLLIEPGRRKTCPNCSLACSPWFLIHARCYMPWQELFQNSECSIVVRPCEDVLADYIALFVFARSHGKALIKWWLLWSWHATFIWEQRLPICKFTPLESQIQLKS